MEAASKYVHRVADIMESNSRGVQVTSYSIALIGLTVAMRKVRPFSRFKKPSDIPNHFINEKRLLDGFVKRIEPNGNYLMIEHKPLVSLPMVPEGELPVKILGVKLSGLGLNWLQAIVVDNNVKFIPVVKDKDAVQCKVLMTYGHGKNQVPINIGETLIKIGFADRVPVMGQEDPILTDPSYLSYFKILENAELYALKQRLGLKYYAKPVQAKLLQMGYLMRKYYKKARKVDDWKKIMFA